MLSLEEKNFVLIFNYKKNGTYGNHCEPHGRDFVILKHLK